MTNVKKTQQPVAEKKKRFKIKMPSALTIIVGVVLFVTMLTWIPHSAGLAGANDAMGWESGSLASWQNYIFINGINTWLNLNAPTADLLDTNSAINHETVLNLGHIYNDYMNTALSTNEYSDWVLSFVDSNGLPIESNTELQFEAMGLEFLGSIADTYGLDGSFDTASGYFITDTWVTFTLGGYADGANSMFGFFDAFKALLGGYQDAFGVAIYIVGIYALVLLLMETETLKAGVSSLVKGLGGKEILLVPLLFVLFSLGGTLFGMQEETLGLIPVIVPVFVLAGFDAPLGMLVVVLGTTTGIAASVLDPFSVAVFAAGIGESIGTALIERLILFLVYTSLGVGFTMWYALRVKKNNEKSLDAEALESNKVWAKEHIGDISELESMNKKQRYALMVFAVVFAWMIFSLMPWTTWFEGLADSTGWVVFSSMFYGHVLLGEWYFIELAILFFLAVFVVGKIFNMSFGKILNTCWKSLTEMFGVITIIAFSRATAIILATSGLTYGMIYSVIDTSATGTVHPIQFTLIWLLIFGMMAFFIPSTSGLAGITSPLAGGVISAQATDPHAHLMAVGLLMAYPLAQGVINMFSPTTGLVVVQAEQSKVNYGRVLPYLAGYAATIFVVGVIMISLILGIEMAF